MEEKKKSSAKATKKEKPTSKATTETVEEVKVEATEENRLLIEALIRREWLSSFKAVDEQYIIYPKKNIKP